jgi:putative transposase
MPRVARIVVPGAVHHVTQRGNNRQAVFFTDDDRRAYLAFLQAQCRRHRVGILGYCLMTNHVHLVLRPATADGLAKALGRAHWNYAQHVNRLHERSGHLWQNRFYSHALDDHHAPLVMRYVECNPRRAKIWDDHPQTYPWSSAAAHCARATRKPPAHEFLDLNGWARLYTGGNWANELRAPVADPDAARIRRTIQTGRPLASEQWLARQEKRLSRPLRANPPGRPKGTKAKKRRAVPEK